MPTSFSGSASSVQPHRLGLILTFIILSLLALLRSAPASSVQLHSHPVAVKSAQVKSAQPAAFQTQLLAINAGGGAATPFAADTDYSGGSTDTITSAITTSGVANPAPQAVYQSERWGNFTYSLPGFTPGTTYTLRLHFAETYFGPGQPGGGGIGARQFNVAVNGTPVLTNFDIFAAAGGADIAIVKSYPATADASGNITVAFTNGAADNAKISGIEVLAGAPAPTLTSIAVSPASATLNTGGTQQFTAVANDQNGKPLTPQPALAWTSTGVGTITTTGFYSAGTTAGTATVTAASGSVSGTAAVTVNAAATTPLYLSNLTLNSTAVTGGSGTTGTVTLSSPAPAGGVTVALLSNNSAAIVPATCTIAAGATQATFNVTTTAVSAGLIVALSGSYNGWTQGDELSVLAPGSPSGPPPGTSFDVASVQVAPGNGCAVVDWGRLQAGTVNGYNVYRTSGGITTLLTSTPFKGNDYPDTGLTNDTATYSYQVSAVDTLGQEHALSAPVSITPSSAAATLNWINPQSAVIDNSTMDVSLSSGGQVFGTIFFIDGVQAGGGGSFSRPVNGIQTNLAGASLDSSKLSNGPHTVQFLGFVDANRTIACVTPPITIQVSNTISSFHIDNSWFYPGQGELCYVSATAPAGSTWTVQATSEDGTRIIRTWQGASPLVKLAWDGKDASGNLVTIDDYTIQLTVQPPGTSPQTATPSGTKSTQPAPNAAAASKKTRPVKMQAGQPVALALVSIGASFYVDSNGVSVPTPSADIKLSDVTLKNAYTQLYGAGNFRIIRSDTFDPYLVVGKDLTALQQLEGWLRTAQVFYLVGHGAGTQGPPGPSQTSRSTAFGSIDDTGVHIEFFPAMGIFIPSDEDIIVPTYVGTHQYIFAWIDSCNSAGGNTVTGQRGTEDDVWATAFNAITFIGNNGFAISNNHGPTGLSDWYKWRSTFWNNLAMGQNVTQAYLTCWTVDGKGKGPGGTNIPYGTVDPNIYPDYYFISSTRYDCTPGDGYGGNPRVVLHGEPGATTLVPQ